MPIAIKMRNVWIVERRAWADGDLYYDLARTSEIMPLKWTAII
jgi:hypothetical protein